MKLSRAAIIFLSLFLVSVFVTENVYSANQFGISGMSMRTKRQQGKAARIARDAGIGWTRKIVQWRLVVPEPPDPVDPNWVPPAFDWADLDDQIQATLNQNLKIFVLLRCVHKVMAPGSGDIDIYEDDPNRTKMHVRAAPPASAYLEHWEQFVAAVVERYDGDGNADAPFITSTKNIKHWRIEVEPGKFPDRGSHNWLGTPQEYADHFKMTYDAIKTPKLNPDGTISSPATDADAQVALAAFTWGALQYYLQNSVSFLSETLNHLKANRGNFDIFDFHFYRDYDGFFRFNKAIGLHETIFSDVQNHYHTIWVTETNVDFRTVYLGYAEDEYDRFVAKDIVKRYCVLLNGGVEKVFWFNFEDKRNATWEIPTTSAKIQRFQGLTKRNGATWEPKPVYYTYQLLIDKLDVKNAANIKRRPGFEDTAEALLTDTNVWAYQFGVNTGANNSAVYVMWYEPPCSAACMAPCPPECEPDCDPQCFQECIPGCMPEQVQVPVQLPWDSITITHVISEPGQTAPVVGTMQPSEVLPGNIYKYNITLSDSPIFIENSAAVK